MNRKNILIIPLMVMGFAVSAMAGTERAIYTISDAVHEAIVRNPVINEAEALTQSAGEVVKKARADMFAKASMTYSYNGLEVNHALLNLNVAAKNIRTAQDSLGQAKENWRITKVQYAEQVATSTDVLDARAFLSRADTNYYGALYGYMIYLAELDRALGRRI